MPIHTGSKPGEHIRHWHDDRKLTSMSNSAMA